MPGSTVTTLPTTSASLPVRASLGASWTSIPTPCPRPCPKCSPWPFSVIMSRATASISLPAGPDGVQRGDLGPQGQLVGLREVVGDVPRRPRAGAVGAVAVEPHPHVERD